MHMRAPACMQLVVEPLRAQGSPKAPDPHQCFPPFGATMSSPLEQAAPRARETLTSTACLALLRGGGVTMAQVRSLPGLDFEAACCLLEGFFTVLAPLTQRLTKGTAQAALESWGLNQEEAARGASAMCSAFASLRDKSRHAKTGVRLSPAVARIVAVMQVRQPNTTLPSIVSPTSGSPPSTAAPLISASSSTELAGAAASDDPSTSSATSLAHPGSLGPSAKARSLHLSKKQVLQMYGLEPDHHVSPKKLEVVSSQEVVDTPPAKTVSPQPEASWVDPLSLQMILVVGGQQQHVPLQEGPAGFAEGVWEGKSFPTEVPNLQLARLRRPAAAPIMKKPARKRPAAAMEEADEPDEEDDPAEEEEGPEEPEEEESEDAGGEEAADEKEGEDAGGEEGEGEEEVGAEEDEGEEEVEKAHMEKKILCHTMWYARTQAMAIRVRGGKQICQFGGKRSGYSEAELRNIGGQVVQELNEGRLAQDQAKQRGKQLMGGLNACV